MNTMSIFMRYVNDYHILDLSYGLTNSVFGIENWKIKISFLDNFPLNFLQYNAKMLITYLVRDCRENAILSA